LSHIVRVRIFFAQCGIVAMLLRRPVGVVELRDCQNVFLALKVAQIWFFYFHEHKTTWSLAG
jgi:hypothetical protein